MRAWQRRARVGIVLGVVALAVVVAFTFQRRVEVPPASVTRADPKAIVETSEGTSFRFNSDREAFRIAYRELRTYPDGSATLFGVKATTERGGGRTFTISAEQAQVDKNESNYIFEGNVLLESSDGLSVQTKRATYRESDGVVRSDGETKFSRGRTSGSGYGFTYDKNRDVVRLRDDVVVNIAPSADGGGPMTITTETIEVDRQQHVIRFETPFKATRGREIIEADTGVGRLTADDERLQMLELRRRSRITAAPGKVGSLQSMTGRDIDLEYGADGETVEDAVINGDAAIRVAGEPGQPPREITAETIDISLADDGSVPTVLVARGQVELVLPPQKDAAGRTINADTLESKGEEGTGLTSATFTGKVNFRERGPEVDRTATSETLQVALKPGLSAIDEATFTRGVRFVDGTMTATAAQGRYVLAQGVLDLGGTDASAPRPAVRNDQIAVEALKIQVTLEGPQVHASGAVRSDLRPRKRAAAGQQSEPDTKMPSMFKQDQPVNITADDLKYDGGSDTATYTGNVQLWQGETTIKGATISVDSKSGDLAASGDPVATTAVLMQTRKDGKKERSVAVAKSRELNYEEEHRRATYAGDAFVNGPQGELRAARIELYLKPSGDELERVEAYEGVTLTEQKQKITGDRLTYTSADERYLVTGKPLKIVDECGAVTDGITLTYLKGAERIIVDGTPQSRTRTQGGGKCP